MRGSSLVQSRRVRLFETEVCVLRVDTVYLLVRGGVLASVKSVEEEWERHCGRRRRRRSFNVCFKSEISPTMMDDFVLKRVGRCQGPMHATVGQVSRVARRLSFCRVKYDKC